MHASTAGRCVLGGSAVVIDGDRLASIDPCDEDQATRAAADMEPSGVLHEALRGQAADEVEARLEVLTSS